MRRILFLFLDASVAAVLLLPVFWLLGKYTFRRTTKAVSYFLMAVYLCAVYSVVGLPSVTYIRLDINYNVIPFAYMFSDYGNSLLNILLFVPLGFFLPVFWKRYQKCRRTVLFGFFLSLLIELLQLFSFRATDVNDLMTNTLGTVLGWCIGRLILRLTPSVSPSWKTKELWLLCSLSFSIMFFVHPFVMDWLYPILFS